VRVVAIKVVWDGKIVLEVMLKTRVLESGDVKPAS
jgi:hypothetical protein